MISLDLTEIASVHKVNGGKTGRRDYGRLYVMKNGAKIYLAKRTRKEIFVCGKKSISDALRENVAEWAIDDETIMKLRVKAVDFVGICDNTSGTVWMAPIADWMDRAKYTYRNYSGRGGSLQRYMNHQHFEIAEGMKHLITKNIDKTMKPKKLV